MSSPAAAATTITAPASGSQRRGRARSARATFRRTRTLFAGWGGSQIAFNPSGDLLAVLPWNEEMKLFDAVTGQLLLEAPPTTIRTLRPRFARDGRRLACAEQGGRLGLWEIDPGHEYRTLHHQGDEGQRKYDFPAVGPGQLDRMDSLRGHRVRRLVGGRDLPKRTLEGAPDLLKLLLLTDCRRDSRGAIVGHSLMPRLPKESQMKTNGYAARSAGQPMLAGD